MPTERKHSPKRRSDGEGSLYQRHEKTCTRRDGKCKCGWVGALVLGYRDAKPVRRKVSAPTRSGAATRLQELREQHRNEQLPAAGRPVTVEHWMRHWLTQIAPRKVGDLTIANSYTTKVEQYIIPLLGHHRIDRLTPELIEGAWDHLRTVGNPVSAAPRPLSDSTVLQTHRILARALKVAVQRKRLRVNPADSNAMDAPSAAEKEMSVLAVDQVQAILATCAGSRLEARWSVALSLGLRQGEALGLRWEDVDLESGVLRVRQALKRVKGKGITFGPPKSARGRRDIALPAELLSQLKAHRRTQTADRLAAGELWRDTGLVFTREDGGPIEPSADAKAWRALLVQAGVPHVRLHDARHSAATLLLLQGVDTRVVMDILGHSQISVTMKYQHAVDQLKRDAAERVGAALWPSSRSALR